MTEEENNIESENTKYKDGVNRNARLIIRNISFKATEDSLREHFTKFGTVEEVKLLKKPDGKLVGCAFVHYTQVPMANKALAATHKKPFLGRPIYVAWAVPKHQYNGEQVVPQNNKRKNSGSSDENKPEIKDEDDDSNNKKSNEEKNTPRVNRNARLIVRNVSFKATEDTLKEHFEPYGNILEVKLLKKPDGKLVGCAFVHFKNVPMAKKALLDTNMKPFLGRPISVDWAVPKDRYMQHVVNKQLEMQDDVKKEDSDSDDEPVNVSSEVKQEVKSESGDSSDDEDEKPDIDEESDSEEKQSDSDGDDEEEDDDDDDDGEEDLENDGENDDESVTNSKPVFQRTKLNDAEDGCTVFITNIPFSVDDHQLQTFAEGTGPVKYALICVDKLTEHSKGTGFIKFVNKEDTDGFLALPPDQLRLEGQVLSVKPALKKENLQQGNKKQPKDNRNLYLVKEGVVCAGTRAAQGVSQSDMAKRLALERSKTQMLKNLNRFVSRYRLVVSNLTPNITDDSLRRLVVKASPARAAVTEARVMRDLRAPAGRDGRHPSKGYGFAMFTRHEDALAALRALNNNPTTFDTHNRPIVSFSIEDRTALNARKKRLEKSIANNPLAKKDDENDNSKKGKRNRKRKMKAVPDESYMKQRKVETKTKNGKEIVGRFVRPPVDEEAFTGLTAKEGTPHKIRNNHKLRAQADIHRQNVKLEKKKSKRTHRLKMAARERVKQPKQKINKNKIGKRNKKRNFNNEIR